MLSHSTILSAESLMQHICSGQNRIGSAWQSGSNPSPVQFTQRDERERERAAAHRSARPNTKPHSWLQPSANDGVFDSAEHFWVQFKSRACKPPTVDKNFARAYCVVWWMSVRRVLRRWLIGAKCAPRAPLMAHNLIIVLLLQAGTPFGSVFHSLSRHTFVFGC